MSSDFCVLTNAVYNYPGYGRWIANETVNAAKWLMTLTCCTPDAATSSKLGR